MAYTPHRDLSAHANKRVAEAYAAMSRIRETFNAGNGDNRHGFYGRSCRESFARHAAVVRELIGEEPPSIYYDR